MKIDEVENYKEMKDWFLKRTNRHIELVQKYCKLIEDYDDRFKGLVKQSQNHDSSKFEDPELEPYIYIAWQYKCKRDDIDFEVSDKLADEMSRATEHHVKNNKHHPEYHSDKEVDLINRENRDLPPEEIIDATKMPDLDVAEMCADWMAMSEEKGTDPMYWADTNVNVRWEFTKDQKGLIYELLGAVFND